ncbi:hypothetical protein ABPG75_008181 [Micractinium tetrahymenae]
MAPLLQPQDFLAEAQIQDVAENPILTPAQLHLLRQQIDTLRRLNVQLRALKYRARTGQEPPFRSELAALALSGGKHGGGGGGRGRGRGRGRGADAEGLVISGGRGRGRGRGRGKRSREDEEEDDDSIVVRSSEEEEEEEATGSSGSEEEGQDESLESADSEESEDDFTLPTVTQPRRTGRARRPSKAAEEQDGSSSSSSDKEEGQAAAAAKPEEQQQQQQEQQQAPAPAGPEDADQDEQEAQEQGGGLGAAKQRPGKAAASGAAGAGSPEGDGPKRKALFMVVSEEASDAAGAPLPLPQLKPVVPPRPKKAAEGDEEAEGAEADAQEQQGAVEEDEEEAVCSVCGDDEAPEDNVILLCEGKGCSVAVHQLCYGVHAVPEGEWLCDACKAKLKPAAANCCICPVVGGAVKKVTSLGRVVPAAAKGKGGRGGKGGTAGPYCHLACALWVPEVELSDVPGMSGVRLDKLTAVRAKLRCELCKQAGGGAVQCAFGTCCRSFHVLCGRAAGQQLHFRTTDGEPLAFCALHSKPTFAKLVDELVEGKRPLEPAGAPLVEAE